MVKISPSSQDYLEIILDLSKDGAPVRSIDIANALGYSRASINRAVNVLKSAGLVAQEKYGTLSLTEEGQTTAQAIRERHDILKNFFIDLLQVSESTAEEDACRMEHIISEETLIKLVKYTKEVKSLF